MSVVEDRIWDHFIHKKGEKVQSDILQSLNDPNYIAIFNQEFISQIHLVNSDDSPAHADKSRLEYKKILLTGPYADAKFSYRFSSRWLGNLIPLKVYGTGNLLIKDSSYYRDFIEYLYRD